MIIEIPTWMAIIIVVLYLVNSILEFYKFYLERQEKPCPKTRAGARMRQKILYILIVDMVLIIAWIGPASYNPNLVLECKAGWTILWILALIATVITLALFDNYRKNGRCMILLLLLLGIGGTQAQEACSPWMSGNLTLINGSLRPDCYGCTDEGICWMGNDSFRANKSDLVYINGSLNLQATRAKATLTLDFNGTKTIILLDASPILVRGKI